MEIDRKVKENAKIRMRHEALTGILFVKIYLTYLYS